LPRSRDERDCHRATAALALVSNGAGELAVLPQLGVEPPPPPLASACLTGDEFLLRTLALIVQSVGVGSEQLVQQDWPDDVEHDSRITRRKVNHTSGTYYGARSEVYTPRQVEIGVVNQPGS